MDIDVLFRFLTWSLVINYGVLLIWFFAFVFAHDWMRSLHGRWFKMSDETFDGIHYGAMAAYKLTVFFFNLVPLAAIYFMRG